MRQGIWKLICPEMRHVICRDNNETRYIEVQGGFFWQVLKAGTQNETRYV